MHPMLKDLMESWDSPIVPRSEIERFSGNLIKKSYIANLDSRGQGPERVKIGRRVCYPLRPLCKWLDARLSA